MNWKPALNRLAQLFIPRSIPASRLCRHEEDRARPMTPSLQTKAPTRPVSFNRLIFRAAASVGMAGVAVKLVAVGKEMAVAGAYGRSDAVEAFFAAVLIPTLLINLISESMNQALVPTFVRVRDHEGRERAQQLFSSALVWMCLLLALLSCAMALAARGLFPLIASHFSAPKLELSIRLFYGLLPVVMLTGVATLCTGVLNTFNRFALPALAPMVNSIAIILGALLLAGRFGIWAMVYATLAGALAHAALVGGMLERHGLRLRLRWYGMTEATREVGRQYGPVLLSGAVASGGLVVDQAMAAMLPAGSVSALVYASRFVSVILTLLAGSVSSAVTPYFSAMIANGDWAECRHTLRTWVRATLLVSAPVALALVAAARLLVRASLQHGAFGPHDTPVVTRVLVMFAIQIPFFAGSRVYYRFLVAFRRTDLIFYCGAINLVLDVVLDLILMHWFGVAGIALASSVWNVSSFLFLRYWTQKLLPGAAAVATARE
jgi:putative peptidoglycan lipid II flippase